MAFWKNNKVKDTTNFEDGFRDGFSQGFSKAWDMMKDMQFTGFEKAKQSLVNQTIQETLDRLNKK